MLRGIDPHVHLHHVWIKPDGTSTSIKASPGGPSPIRSGMTDRAGEFHLILLPKEEVRAARFGQSINIDYANVRNELLNARPKGSPPVNKRNGSTLSTESTNTDSLVAKILRIIVGTSATSEMCLSLRTVRTSAGSKPSIHPNGTAL
jgi:hypothetical protein